MGEKAMLGRTYSQNARGAPQHKFSVKNNFLNQISRPNSLILNNKIFALGMSILLKPA
jgi:hypothetical protein